ncbi:hypothetical protein BGLA2_1720096 [Burkholderia gladioli]|nr:hypothetical protein BGLA2_1720096 [Burkholderia gladioli]
MVRGGVRHRFFYLHLCAGEQGGSQESRERHSFPAEGVDHVLVAYGIRRFLAEIDSGRDFGAQGGIVGSFLNFVANEGFQETFERYECKYRCARDFRERNLLELLRTLRGGNG